MNIADLVYNTPRIATAFAEWAACLTYILILKKKHLGIRHCLSLAGILLWFMIYHYFAEALPVILWIPGMIGAILSIFFSIKLICSISYINTCFLCIRAFVLAEFAASLQWQISIWFMFRVQKSRDFIFSFVMLIIYMVTFYLYYKLEKSHFNEDTPQNISLKELRSSVIIGFTAFAISNLSFVYTDTPFSAASDSILYIRTLVDFCGLSMLMTQAERLQECRFKYENELMKLVIERQYNQYRSAITNQELLRREYHDLKHYMLAIKEAENNSKRDQYLGKMEQAISIQESLSNTGNPVLDVILTTKSTHCIQNNITFSCLADGKILDFMHVKDICSIFGNAIDNAIECVSQYADSEKRYINVSVFLKNNFLMMQFENYIENPLNLQHGKLPATTKSQSFSHGFGLKSIQASSEKYGGTMRINSHDHCFTLCILIPLKFSDEIGSAS